jgi:hypothetical protein
MTDHRHALQMNYWLAEVCNLSECHEPFFDLKLHQESSFPAFEWVIRCGGLLRALPGPTGCRRPGGRTPQFRPYREISK